MEAAALAASALLEPVAGLLADGPRRRAVVLTGGVALAVAFALAASAPAFVLFAAAFAVYYPASGALVSISQASLMDAAPAERERSMARWALAGSVGVLIGPLVLAGLLASGASWRAGLGLLAVLALALVAVVARVPLGRGDDAEPPSLRAALAALRNREVLRWILLLEVGDLVLDVLTGFLALWLVDEAGFAPATAALVLAVWAAAGLAGDALLLLVVRRGSGLPFVRAGALAALVLLPAFLLLPPVVALAALVPMHVLTTGWYAVLQARLYESLPGRSGTVVAVTAVVGLVGAVPPVVLGVVADGAGLEAAMWLLLVAPVAVLAGLRRVR